MNYIIVVILLVLGLLILVTTKNLIKKIVGLGIFQTAILLFYISMGKVHGGVPPIVVAMSLVSKINQQFSTINDDEINKQLNEDEFTS